MTLSEREQHILDDLERGLRPARTEAVRLPAAVRTLLAVVIGLVAVVIVVALMRSEAAGLTLLVGFGLLGVIGYLHRYNLRHPA